MARLLKPGIGAEKLLASPEIQDAIGIYFSTLSITNNLGRVPSILFPSGSVATKIVATNIKHPFGPYSELQTRITTTLRKPTKKCFGKPHLEVGALSTTTTTNTKKPNSTGQATKRRLQFSTGPRISRQLCPDPNKTGVLSHATQLGLQGPYCQMGSATCQPANGSSTLETVFRPNFLLGQKTIQMSSFRKASFDVTANLFFEKPVSNNTGPGTWRQFAPNLTITYGISAHSFFPSPTGRQRFPGGTQPHWSISIRPFGIPAKRALCINSNGQYELTVFLSHNGVPPPQALAIPFINLLNGAVLDLRQSAKLSTAFPWRQVALWLSQKVGKNRVQPSPWSAYSGCRIGILPSANAIRFGYGACSSTNASPFLPRVGHPELNVGGGSGPGGFPPQLST